LGMGAVLLGLSGDLIRNKHARRRPVNSIEAFVFPLG
jgi:hypothetical protein